jgi:hypothetical protein
MVAAGDMSQGVVRRLGVGDLAEKLQGVRQPRRGGSRWGATSWLWLVYLSCGDDLTPVASDTHPDFKLQCQRSTFNAHTLLVSPPGSAHISVLSTGVGERECFKSLLNATPVGDVRSRALSLL